MSAINWMMILSRCQLCSCVSYLNLSCETLKHDDIKRHTICHACKHIAIVFDVRIPHNKGTSIIDDLVRVGDAWCINNVHWSQVNHLKPAKNNVSNHSNDDDSCFVVDDSDNQSKMGPGLVVCLNHFLEQVWWCMPIPNHADQTKEFRCFQWRPIWENNTTQKTVSECSQYNMKRHTWQILLLWTYCTDRYCNPYM